MPEPAAETSRKGRATAHAAGRRRGRSAVEALEARVLAAAHHAAAFSGANRLMIGGPAHVMPRAPHRGASVPAPAPTPSSASFVPVAPAVAAPVAAPPLLAPPPKPTILTADAGSRTHSIALSWTEVTGETGYAVERSTDGITWAQAGTTAADVTSFYDAGLTENTQYQYRVRALGAGGGGSSVSDPVSARTASFTMFDATAFGGGAATAGHPLAGMAPITWANTGFWTADLNFDEAGTRAVARVAAAKGQMLVFDIERFPFALSQAPAQVVDQYIAKYTQLVAWARSEEPKLKVGFFEDLPLRSPTDNAYLLQRLAPVVDFVSLDAYLVAGEDLTTWTGDVQREVAAAAPYHMPFYLFVTPDLIASDLLSSAGPVPGNLCQYQLSLLRQSVDGIVLWSANPAPLDTTAAWWRTTQSFLSNPPHPLTAPALKLDPLGARLSWMIAARDVAPAGAGAGGFEIDRSTDGGATFKPVAFVPADARSWADSGLVGGADSWYHVEAIGSLGDSPPSNLVHAVVSRSAPGTIQAEDFEAQSGGLTTQGGWVGAIDPGDWAEYRSVDFGSAAGANQFSVRIACPSGNDGQRIAVHLDAPTGPLVGTLTVAATGGWASFVTQSTAIAPTTGLHDVYLVFLARPDGIGGGVGALDWLSFGLDAAPAAPTNLVVNSAGSHLALTWTADSSDQTAFSIERSTDGGATFAPIASVPAGATSYNDAAISVGARYYYRVRAVNAYGTSAPSNVDNGIGGTEYAFSPILPGSPDATGAPNWVAYYHLDFGSGAGARTFTASMGAPFGNEGETFQLRLDDASGPLIGTVVTQATGGFNVYVPQTTLLNTAVTGVHDLYMVFSSEIPWYKAMNWFRFGA